MLVQCAHGASVKIGSYLKDKYYKLKSRIGGKKATIAIGHKILVSAYHILKNKEGYKELGAHYLDKLKKDKLLKHYKNKLEQLGYEVLLAEKEAA